MSDGLVLTADPTLPSTGLRAEVAAIVKQNVRQILIDAISDRLGHAYAVASGKVHFRAAFVREMGSFWGNNRAQADNVADAAFQFLETAWRDRYPGESAFAFLDSAHVPSEQSAKEIEKEIEDAWEVEIAGSEEAMRQHYHGSARVRKGKEIFSTFWQRQPKGVQ